MKIGYQLKQVRERLAKGLVDKGILRTEKRNFLLFDMATHPLNDTSCKDAVLRRCSRFSPRIRPACTQAPSTRRMPRRVDDPLHCASRVRCACSAARFRPTCSRTRSTTSRTKRASQRSKRRTTFSRSLHAGHGAQLWPCWRRRWRWEWLGCAHVDFVERTQVQGERRREDRRRVDAQRACRRRRRGGCIHSGTRKGPAEGTRSRGDTFMFECIAAVLNVLSRMDSLL